ncbi:protein OSCA1-like [Malus domestica]|uniref:protein OSCA1-like n=1 Tax=Malus domestica TaxID=3750 RepID=UPI0039760DC2
MPAAFVSFRTRWGAAVCAQTQQSRNPTIWLTEWAPEPHDVYWDNLAIPYVTLTIRRLIVAVAFFFLTFFFMIPIAFVQSLANIEGIEKAVPYLKPIIEESHKIIYPRFPAWNCFEDFSYIPSLYIDGNVQMKATFFITYIMVDGWAGIAGEILRLKPLIIYHLKNFFLVKTEKDRKRPWIPEPLVSTPIINVYNQEYESAAAFWPDVHGRIITALIVSQLLLMGLLSTKEAAQSTPLLITLPVLTIWLHKFCKGRYEPAFIRHPLQEAMMKDTLERIREPNLNMKGFLQNAYIHPVFKGEDDSENDAPAQEFEKEPAVVLTKRSSRRNTPMPSKYSGSSSSASIPEDDTQKMIP